MLQKERQNQIIEMLKHKKTVTIKDLAKHFGVSIITIRRDFDILAEAGAIQKIYGGAMLPEAAHTEAVQPFFSARIEKNRTQKLRIANAAAALVQDGDTIVLDIGTTCLEVAKQLKKRSNITVLTNSLPILYELVGTGITVYSLGGLLRSGELALCGSVAMNSLNDFCVNKAFIGAGGVTLENGLTNHNRDNATLCSAIIHRADQAILVADSSKFGRNAFAVIGPVECVDTIITDNGISKEYAQEISQRGVHLVVAE
ncbi:MAG: DeoR/GlpR transcriptional regulator [Oscillospiraceae bacterium]|nr:DeoR/GlpR transcriptional regulator [Oscillospiraceae bacterium]